MDTIGVKGGACVPGAGVDGGHCPHPLDNPVGSLSGNTTPTVVVERTKNWGPRCPELFLDHCMCCFSQKRVLIATLTVDSTKPVALAPVAPALIIVRNKTTIPHVHHAELCDGFGELVELWIGLLKIVDQRVDVLELVECLASPSSASHRCATANG
jgi:hypothetical protein